MYIVKKLDNHSIENGEKRIGERMKQIDRVKKIEVDIEMARDKLFLWMHKPVYARTAELQVRRRRIVHGLELLCIGK